MSGGWIQTRLCARVKGLWLSSGEPPVEEGDLTCPWKPRSDEDALLEPRGHPQ